MRSRIILSFLALLIVIVLAACGPTPTPEVVREVVKETVMVEKEVEVEVTKVIEKEVVVEATPAPPVEVRLVSWRPTSPEEEDLARYLLDRCGVTYEFRPDYGDYWYWLQAMFAAGEEFDILYMDTAHFPFFAQQGFLAPLDDASGIRQGEFIDTLIDAFTSEGTAYAIPSNFTTLALFYNKDLFDEAGVEPPNDDWTWADLEKAAYAITDFLGVPGFSVPASPSRFPIFVFQNGGGIMTEDFSDTLIDSDKAIGAGEFYTNARWEGWAITPEDVGVGWQGEAFGQGKVAMILESDRMIYYLSRQFPGLAYGAVPPPAGLYGEEGNLVFATAYAVSANSSDWQEALRAIDCLTSWDNQILVLESGLALPSRKYLEEDKYFQDNPAAYAIYTGAEFATPYTWGPRHEEVNWIIGEALERVYEGMSVKESFWQAAEEIRGVTGE